MTSIQAAIRSDYTGHMIQWTAEQLDAFVQLLHDEAYEVLGPVIRDGAVTYGAMQALPVGYGDEQAAGHYRLTQRGDQTRFGYNLGPSTWKQFLFPPSETLFSVRDDLIHPVENQPGKRAFIGVRACEMAAIEVQDRVFLQGEYTERRYEQRRQQVFIVAVNCSQAAATCFCTANDDGPAVRGSADMVLTEVNPQQPWYLVEAISETAKKLVAKIGGAPANDEQHHQAQAAVNEAAEQISRQLPRKGLRDALFDALEHPQWDDVASRCLSCGNCTQVCPTCFCSTTQEQTDLVSMEVRHQRLWDSCFTEMHSYTTGGAIHHKTRSRYRQWLTHKLAAWEDQFDVSGCTGCGRCISWCPVGIDLTEEVEILRKSP
ncbi:MAG: 4Fe-4S dicluster domain-containing protein [Halieaceae bacterium]|nr:4Fe-4S dicluster domain-containing protein [Halieaceae bacterium]